MNLKRFNCFVRYVFRRNVSGKFLQFFTLSLIFIAGFEKNCFAAETMSLAGEWRFALDRNDAGISGQWFDKNLPDKIQLPGALEAQGYGDPISIHTPWVLTLYDHFWYLRADYAAYTNAGSVKVPFLCQPPRHYLGAAWYQRDIEIPMNWDGKRVVLFLERPHWKSTVWLDDNEIGSDISLCAPHEYDFGIVPPGKHRLTIRVDNRMILPYRPDAHSVSDSLDDAWNGIVGKIELRATPPVWVDAVQIYPDAKGKKIHAGMVFHNISGENAEGKISYFIEAGTDTPPLNILPGSENFNTTATNIALDEEFNLGDNAKTWDEFSPALYKLEINTRGEIAGKKFQDDVEATFGLRDFHADGNQFILNGHPIYFRGTHFGGDFPLTGYPPTDVASWKKIIQTCKNYGLNHIRFHSWCPPEAAFEAADELGFYFQVECGMWNSFAPGGEMEKQLYSETERILRDFGNHPSLMLISASNEAHGNWKPVLSQWVKHFRAEDNRHLYTPDTGWSLIDSPDEPINGGADYLAVGRIGPNHVRGERGWFGRDYRDAIAGVTIPVIAHEVGQWCAYPDFDIIKKFTGFMRPGNFEIFRDSAEAHGLLKDDKKFALASGKFQLECYKEEIEANLRTPGLDGFQLLDLHDYVGQGTALVGLLDPFWQSKGYATPEELKIFCNTVVPLARLTKRVFTTADKFNVPVEIANFDRVLTNVPLTWEIVDSSNDIVTNGWLGSPTIPIGKNFSLGKISTDLSKLPAPAAYKLVVETQNPSFADDWDFWLYPADDSAPEPKDVLVTSSWNEAKSQLAAGGKVLFLPRNTDLYWDSPPLDDVPIFWNRLMNPAWSRMLGLWCDTNSPALAEFPTEANCDWQWTQIIRGVRAVNLDRLPRGFQPIVQAIDDWNRNWKLGAIFECRIGPGRLMVCVFDLDSDLEHRPVARQLRRSLLDYMAGPDFEPKTKVSAEEFQGVLFDTRIMRELDATASGEGANASAAIDGDPNTYWLAGGRGRSGTRYPHALTISFPKPVTMNGIVFMPRQNDRDHLGDVRNYYIEVSDDGRQWRNVADGELASTWSPQRVKFGQTVTASQLRFTALSGFGNDTSTAIAELAVLYAGPALPAKNSENMKYRRSRSTSMDVDEGTGRSTNSTNSLKPVPEQ
jgi:beta-galactosidase